MWDMQKGRHLKILTFYNLIQKLNNRRFFLTFYAILLSFALMPYYIGGTVILGGEGDYVLDFSRHLGKFGFSWFYSYGVGISNMCPSGTGINILFLCLIEKVTGSILITNFILIFSIYFLPFLAMFLVCKELKTTPFVSFIISYFYIINPFTLYYLTCLNQWNVFSVTVIPLFFWIILRYYHNNFRLFLALGFVSTCFSFAYTNYPMLVIIHISMVFSIFLTSYLKNDKLLFMQIFKKYGVILVSFTIFNFWWILPFLGTIGDAQKFYTKSAASDWLTTTTMGGKSILAKAFFLKTIIGSNSSWDVNTRLYNSCIASFITLIPIFFIIYFVLLSKDKKTKCLNVSIFGVLLIILFFVKGSSQPFGFIYTFLFKHLPFFYIFKSPVEKFSILYVFVFSILLMLIMNSFNKQKYNKSVVGIFTAYLIFCSMPLLTGNLIPDMNIGPYGYCSRKYKDKVEYQQAREVINNDSRMYRVLSMPGSGNYQLCMPNYENNIYTGLDPVLMNTNKPFIAPEHHISILYDNISSKNYRKLLGIFNIGKIIINEDSLPWFGYTQKESIAELKTVFSECLTAETWGPITLYENENYFLPIIYASIPNVPHSQ